MYLYFAGSRNKIFDDELQRLGANRLLSNFSDRNAIYEWIDFFDKNPNYPGKFFVDSGAYSTFHQGKPLDVDDYINFINEIGDYVTVFAQMDCIISPDASPQEYAVGEEKTWQNYLYMCEKLKPQYVDKLIPLYHAGENIERFYNLLEYKHSDGRHIKYIGLGAPQRAYAHIRSNYYKDWFKIIEKSSNPDVCTHAFGCTDLTVLPLYPFTSADSASWIRSSAAGNILVDDKWYSLSSRCSDITQRFDYKNIAFKEYIHEYVRKRGFTVEQLQTDPHAIYLYNIRYLKQWEDNYVCVYKKSSNLNKVSLF